MAWEKSSERLIEIFCDALPGDDGVERRKMFGYPCAFVNGNMFTGLHQQDLIVRLPEDARAELLAVPGARQFEPMAGRVMREYVAVPRAMHDDAETLSGWIAKSYAFASALPVKVPKERKRKKKNA
jgi:TfoX/Sxy family transcriptional regulator of competence genes